MANTGIMNTEITTNTEIMTKGITANTKSRSTEITTSTEIMTKEIMNVTVEKHLKCQLKSDSNCFEWRLITSMRLAWRTWLMKQGVGVKNWNDNCTVKMAMATTRFST